MIEKLFPKVRGKKGPDSEVSEALAAARQACSTHAGAVQLADLLESQREALVGAFGASHQHRVLLGRQRAVALHAAEYCRLHEDLSTRIPAAITRNTELRQTALEDATKRQEKAKRTQGAAHVAHLARLADLRHLKEARIRAVAAPTAALQSAEQQLGVAQDAGDTEAIDRARTGLNEALRVLEDVERGQRARDLELQVMEGSESRARAAYSAAELEASECAVAASVAIARLGAVEADRATLAALMAHVDLASMKWGDGKKPFSSAFGQAAFYFHDREHAPLCNDEAGWIVVDGWRLKHIVDAFVEPDLRCFEETVQAAASVESELAQSDAVASEQRAAVEPFNPNACYPTSHPHFATATDPRRL